MFQTTTKAAGRTLLLCTVGAVALTIQIPQGAQAQSNLPAVTVDAPRAERARTARQVAGTRAGTTRRVAARREARPPAPVAPVSYVTPSTGTLGALPASYAGGQVASGGQVGFLGNRSILDTPFSQTSYTAQLMQDQQARTIRDVVANDSSVRTVTSAGGGQDGYFIRGFYYDVGDLALNGMYGMAPYWSVGANYIERVEVLKGPTALLTGIAPFGAVGGSINLVTKKAPDYDITQLTATYASRSQFGLQADVARRYGEHKEWGVRFNGSYSNGDTPFDRQSSEFGNAVLGLDYRGEDVRVSADIGYQANNLNPPIRFFSFQSNVVPLPPAPAAKANAIPDWAYWKPKDTFATVRAEVDVTPGLTVYGAAGYHRAEIDFKFLSPTIINQAGDYGSRPFMGEQTFTAKTGEVGLRGEADTGPVNHKFVVNYGVLDRPNENSYLGAASLVGSNIYNYKAIPEPLFSIPSSSSVSLKQWSVGAADTMSILNGGVQAVVGIRRQHVSNSSTDLLTGVTTGQDGAAWSPAYALLVRPLSNVTLYANYIEGLQPGTTVGAGYVNVGQVFPPFQTKQVETGVKVDFGRISVTGSLFDIKQPSAIASSANGVLTLTADGEQRNRGAELNVFGEVATGLRLLGGVTWLDGVLEKTASGLNDGNRAPGVARLNVNLGAEVDVPGVQGLTLTGRVIHTGESYANAANTQVLPAWTRFDLGARYTFLSPWNGKPIVIRAAVENVENLGYYASGYSGVVGLGAPRTYLVSTTFNF
jgi:iron complex outermembrane receptor protein